MGDSHDAAVAALKGQTLRVPDLTGLFRHWPWQTNPHYAALQPFVDDTIRHIAATHPVIERRLRDDIALLAANWYPLADWDDLQALALFAVWIICWDDTVDANEGDLAADLASADAWRALTLRIAEMSLDLGASQSTEPAPSVDVINSVMQDFARRISASSALSQRRRVYDTLKIFVDSCAVEQKLRLEGKIPDYDAYMDIRMGTIGEFIICALIPFANKLPSLPPIVEDSEFSTTLERQSSVILSLFNDVLSLKKELSTDCVINAVAALLTPGKSLDQVVDEVVEKLRSAIKAFDDAATGLLASVDGHEENMIAAKKYIEGCKATVTGTLDFTLKSPRYGLSKLLHEDGSLEIVL